jgi:hypothetical protein
VGVTVSFVTNVLFLRPVINLNSNEGEKLSMYRTNRNWAIIKLILQLKYYDGDYPGGLYAVRRSRFVNLVDRVLLFFG